MRTFTLLPLTLVLFSSHLPSCDAFFFGRRLCRSDTEEKRCGFLRLAVLQRDGIPGTASCEQFCVFFTFSQLECGGCNGIEPQDPISKSPTSPIRSAIPVNVPSPMPNNAPIQSPISTNDPSQIAPPAVTPISSPSFALPVSAPMQIPVHLPVPLHIPTLGPTSVPVPPPLSVPMPIPITLPVRIPVTTPITLPVPIPIPLPLPVLVSTPVPLQLPGQLLPGDYSIYLDVVGVGENDRIFFTNAKSRWESVIRGDLSNFSTASSQGCVYPSLVDDVYICSRFVAIDGPGRVLGSAGPIYFRTTNALAATGDMQFDSADINFLKAQGNFGTVILHEMAHILGTLLCFL